MLLQISFNMFWSTSSLFWDVTQQRLVVRCRRFGKKLFSPSSSVIRLIADGCRWNRKVKPKRRYLTTTLSCETPLKNEYLISTSAEVWNPACVDCIGRHLFHTHVWYSDIVLLWHCLSSGSLFVRSSVYPFATVQTFFGSWWLCRCSKIIFHISVYGVGRFTGASE